MTPEKHKQLDKMPPFIYAGLTDIGKHAFLHNENKGHLLFHIPLIVADNYKINVEDLLSKSRLQQYVLPRQIAMYILCVKTNLSLKKIGRYFNRDHSTVIYARETISGFIDVDKKFKKELSELIGSL